MRNLEKEMPNIIGMQEGFKTMEEAASVLGTLDNPRKNLGIKCIVDTATGETISFVLESFDALSLKAVNLQTLEEKELPKTHDELIEIGRNIGWYLLQQGFTTQKSIVVLLMLAEMIAKETEVSKESFVEMVEEVINKSFVNPTNKSFTQQ